MNSGQADLAPGEQAPQPAPASATGERWFPVAHLLRPQGRRGEVLAEPLTDVPGVFTKGGNFRLAKSPEAAATAPSLTLEDCWRPQGRNAGRVVLKLGGVDSISAAEALAEQQLFVPEATLPALDADTFLVRDLLGCSLYDGETLLGAIVDLQFPVAPDGRTRLPDAADLLVVERQNAGPENDSPAEPILVPFVKSWLEAADLPGKRIIMHLPPGLFD